jgi:hypothetical protein
MPRKDFPSTTHLALPGTLLFFVCLVGSSWAQNETVLYNFVAYPHGAIPPTSLVEDVTGSLYGAANGGAYESGLVFKLTPGPKGRWKETILYQFQGGSDGGGPTGVIFDANGNLYGATAGGGTGCTKDGGCSEGRTQRSLPVR